jgi:carbon-monoxide dehydrogenase medium subunit
VKPSTFRYAAPTSLGDALALRASAEDTVVLAGGQSLIPTMNFRLANPDLVIDLRNVVDLAYVTVVEGATLIGATARQRTVERDDEVHAANPLIREVLQNVAHPVIRNRGTVCGSLAHADPSAELPTLMVTMRGRVTAEGPHGRREIDAADFFEFIFTTTLEPDELLVEAAIPGLERGEGWAFQEFARRHGDYGVAGVATTLRLAEDGTIGGVRLGACGIATTPVVLEECEELLLDKQPTPDLFAEVARTAASSVTVSDDSTTTRAYRQHVLVGLVERTLTTALSRVSA